MLYRINTGQKKYPFNHRFPFPPKFHPIHLSLLTFIPNPLQLLVFFYFQEILIFANADEIERKKALKYAF